MAITYVCNRCGGAIHTYRFINIFDEKATTNPDEPAFEILYRELALAIPNIETIMGYDVRLLDQLRNGVTWVNPQCYQENMNEPAYLAVHGQDGHDEPYYPPLEEALEAEDEEGEEHYEDTQGENEGEDAKEGKNQ
ncbi:Mannitol-1-phosphate 5-dehydrogenase [Verticillium dahliae VDG1]|nr:Mannitol-1-phosphate 5-dehydrogenase [Verticillium dahliae VDG1]